MTKLMKIITAILAFFMLVPGFAKFTEPMATKFAAQIENAQLPYPTYSFLFAQLGLIIAGLLLLSVLLFWKRFSPSFSTLLFYLGHLLVVPVMSVVFYVHMHPDVPAEILPMGIKPPYISAFLITLAVVNILLFATKKSNKVS